MSMAAIRVNRVAQVGDPGVRAKLPRRRL